MTDPVVERARKGDLEAFGELVESYQHRIVNYIRAIVANEADAEDVAQDTFLRAYRALGRFRGQSSFKTWLYQIATNAARSHLGRRRASPETAGAESDDGTSEIDRAASGHDLEAELVSRDRIERALAGLPAVLREAVVLRDVEGLDYREIAEALDIPIGTVESRIFRGRQRLRKILVMGNG